MSLSNGATSGLSANRNYPLGHIVAISSTCQWVCDVGGNPVHRPVTNDTDRSEWVNERIALLSATEAQLPDYPSYDSDTAWMTADRAYPRDSFLFRPGSKQLRVEHSSKNA